MVTGSVGVFDLIFCFDIGNVIFFLELFDILSGADKHNLCEASALFILEARCPFSRTDRAADYGVVSFGIKWLGFKSSFGFKEFHN